VIQNEAAGARPPHPRTIASPPPTKDVITCPSPPTPLVSRPNPEDVPRPQPPCPIASHRAPWPTLTAIEYCTPVNSTTNNPVLWQRMWHIGSFLLLDLLGRSSCQWGILLFLNMLTFSSEEQCRIILRHNRYWLRASTIIGCKPAKCRGEGKRRGERIKAGCKLTAA